MSLLEDNPTPAEPFRPVTEAVVPVPTNGFTTKELVKIVGWMLAAVVIAVSIVLFLGQSQASQDMGINDNEKAVIKINGKLDSMSEDFGEMKTIQAAQGKKLNKIMIKLQIDPNGD